MAKPIIHARSSARRFGGEPEDYLPIHDFLDSSKAVFPDNRHRALTHNSWFIFVVEKVFGHEITVTLPAADDQEMNPFRIRYKDLMERPPRIAKTRQVSVRDICEQHILEDFGGKFIPTPGDYLEGMEYQDWMNNGIKGAPSSHRKLGQRPIRTRTIDLLD